MAAALRFLFALAALLGGLVAGPAAAQTATAYAGGNPVVLSIPVTASVGGRCGFADGLAPSGTISQADFDRTGLQGEVAFTLNCTGPSRVAVVSKNGALVASGSAAPGYTASAPYDVTLNLVGNSVRTSATCAAATLKDGGSCQFRGPASTAQGLRLAGASTGQTGSSVRVSAPAATAGATPQRIAGTYTDTLTITLSTAP
ncbi:MAG TPA: hypothetical protein VGB62_08855 [Allosphingosinicella sp.]